MLILFDFENIQNVYYQNVKQLIIDSYGIIDWKEAFKQGAVAHGHEEVCLRNWNTNVQIFRVDPVPQAADEKLIELASKYAGNRCILVSNDNVLFAAVCAARIVKRKELYPGTKAYKRTVTEQICFSKGELKVRRRQAETGIGR